MLQPCAWFPGCITYSSSWSLLLQPFFWRAVLFRTQQAFAEETLAKNILKHWEWVDVEPPKDLREAFLIHTIRARESKKGSAQILEVYKNAVRETLANGFITRQEVHLLESLRNQLQIRKVDHEKIMSELAEEERDLLSDPARQLSVEKMLQLETYARVLESYLARIFAADGTPDDRFLRELREEYHVTLEEHTAVLDKLLNGTGAVAMQLIEEIKVIERTSHTIQVFADEPSPPYRFLLDLMQRRRERAIERVMHGLGVSPDEDTGLQLREGLSSDHQPTREAAVEGLRAASATNHRKPASVGISCNRRRRIDVNHRDRYPEGACLEYRSLRPGGGAVPARRARRYRRRPTQPGAAG